MKPKTTMKDLPPNKPGTVKAGGIDAGPADYKGR